MRRIDKKMNDNDTLDLLKTSKVIRLAIHDTPYPYIVPLNYAYDAQAHCLYMHCARDGKKLDLITDNPNIAFELDTTSGFTDEDTSSECTTKYQSIIGNGVVSFVQDNDAKRRALSLLMRALVSRDVTDFDQHVVDRTTILMISINECVGKASS